MNTLETVPVKSVFKLDLAVLVIRIKRFKGSCSDMMSQFMYVDFLWTEFVLQN